MKDDFDNGMGLPEDELGGGGGMTDSGDLGLGGMDTDDEMESEAPGRPSGGARARSSSASRKRASAPARKAAASRGKKKSGGARKARAAASRGAKKKGARKAAGRS